MSYYGRGREPTRRLTVSQIKQIEASLEELERRASQWEAKAREWEAVAAECEAKAQELETLAAQAQEQATKWQAEAGQRAGGAAEREEALQAAEEKAIEMQDRLARVQADYQNSKRRLEQRFAIQADEQIMQFVRDLLPVLDNLDRALEHGSPNQADSELMQQGVEITRQGFLDALSRHGVQPIDVAAGQPFDVELHEAVGTVEDPAYPPGTVASVEQKGYTYRGKLLRPARTLVTPMS
jgi:molecular chaperone GrpE